MAKRSFGERLSHLMSTQNITDAQLSKELFETTGTPYAAAYISAVRQGVVVPSNEFSALLADSLEVPHSYFWDETTTAIIDSCIAVTGALTDLGVRIVGPCRTAVSANDRLLAYIQLLNVVGA